MDFSQVAKQLYLGTTPNAQDYHTLRGLGVRLVINLRVERPPVPDLHNPPLHTLWLPVFDTPFVPIPIYMLNRGVHAALEMLADGGGVYTHCAAGVHRAPAMASAILIAQGQTPEEAMRQVKQARPIADPYIWYIKRRILRFARLWHPSPFH